MKSHSEDISKTRKLKKYYRFHARIYDLTRWSFLFGRKQILCGLPNLPPNLRILEVGCGTGKNIQYMEYLFPDASIHGIDLSPDMLNKAHKKTKRSKRVTLVKSRYGSKDLDPEPFDLVLFSYTLSMLGNQTEDVLEQVLEDLNPGGYIAVVDFHDTPFHWFSRWMRNNHVEMKGQVLPMLNKYFSHERSSVHQAYLGFWQYFTFLGRRA